jgi:hypothetical protein
LVLRRGKFVGGLLVALGLAMLVIGAVMPYYKTQQRLEGSGPNVEFTAKRPYWIKSYIIPPIDAGQPVTLSIISDKPGSTVVMFAPYDPQSQTVSGPALISAGFAGDQKGMAVFTNATKTAPYMLMITSYNSSFRFALTSVWSPFYEVRSLITFGIGITPFGLIMIYYDGIVEKREKMIEDAMKHVRTQRRVKG